MGSLCSNIEKDDAPGEKDGQAQRRNSKTLTRQSSKRLHKKISHRLHRQRNQSTSPEDDFMTHHQADKNMAQQIIAAHDEVIDKTLASLAADPELTRRLKRSADKLDEFDNVQDYMARRADMQHREAAISFDFRRTVLASEKERKANEILQNLKKSDNDKVYAAQNAADDKDGKTRRGWGGQKHERYAGDHFLSNVDLIPETDLYKVARKMPKGAHLHIHFNSCLEPTVLLNIAKDMDRMFIMSDKPLNEPLAPANAGTASTEEAANAGKASTEEAANLANLALDSCEIKFQIMSAEDETDKKKEAAEANKKAKNNKNADDEANEELYNLFSPTYASWGPMKYTEFLKQFKKTYEKDPEKWLVSKLVFHEEEVHNHLQTVQGIWAKFDGRTRMMKGLFNYEEAYRAYTRALLENFVKENIQYAEIRPNFMDTNQVWTNDGLGQFKNDDIMEIIIKEYEAFQKETNGYFGGMKVIYCTPRSFSTEKVQAALNECLEFKDRWPQWIAGFDLVGNEAKGKPLKAFIPEFLEFRENCKKAKVDIPFLFHCGETNEIGGDTDGNLVDALLLNSKRIGHGFALPRHPYVMEQMKKKGICLEVCPISNEQLGLTPRIGGHAMYNLLANNVHCTVNSDNGTLFRSSLSHDFYQVMVGKSDMTLHGWRQLIEWSLEHSCMSKEELKPVYAKWEELWEEFLDWIISEYAEPASEDKKVSA
ncbi:putative adenosine/AMP deaminase [Colletotrichum karsti]|uniref:Adenosine/AMP deaminase n=1 Tax=Colletotrichum karsti TaxID=1095194 RepID=A0A9P6LKQ7_9PEZI|nr:putative adenosine/AMP deaminase [Colletotrichum karsti]KAF9876330.1 putative adenosine/AMP deaminase [Colletotrichum karsti]